MGPVDQWTASAVRDEFPLHDDTVADANRKPRRKRDVIDDVEADAVVAAHRKRFMLRMAPGAEEEMRCPDDGRGEANLARDSSGESGQNGIHDADPITRREATV